MRAFAAVALTVVLMSACGGDPTPIEPTATASKPTATSAAPTADTTLKPPTLPKVARQNDSTGAANFVAHWVRVSDYAAHTGNTTLLREISRPECQGCYAYIKLYERTYSSGGWIRGGSNNLRDVTIERSSSSYVLRANVDSADGSFKKSRTAQVQRTPKETLRIAFETIRYDNEWTMVQVGVEK